MVRKQQHSSDIYTQIIPVVASGQTHLKLTKLNGQKNIFVYAGQTHLKLTKLNGQKNIFVYVTYK